ncbi:MAG: hypothetical protein IAC23_09125 [Bacteroidetes bacterium]|uniref:Uncharacterized protein n=1 Tax=Candidatus Cryptobacteroides merdavium TaxID=2840769 RepID=A0A9D9H988_9BACT|nr:hypothetical protein [Candidatus Cryptobacteroides merdavium]
MIQKRYWGKTVASFFLVLFTMPLGHALMKVMETTMTASVLHYSAFAMGAVGLAMVIAGVFVKGDTKQTLWGLFGGLLFWTGWVEFLFAYYAARYGVHYDLVGSGIVTTTTEYLNGIGISHQTLINGVDIKDIPVAELKAMTGSRPEYLIMPATFGIWMMFMVIYIFNTRTGCHAYNWLQKVFFRDRRDEIVPRSMSHHASITTFLELNVMMWTLYLALMFMYDPVFLGDSHPVTLIVAVVCLVGSVFMFRYQLKLGAWGANIRMAVSTVIIFWTFIEVFARNNLLSEFWVDPMNHKVEMFTILACFLALAAFVTVRAVRNRRNA